MPPTEDGPPTEDRRDPPGRAEPARGTLPAGPGRVRVLREAMEANYRLVQYHYVQFLAEHLVDCRRTIGGDFDDLMILAVLGQRLLQARIEMDAGDAGAEARIWMSALRLSDVTGVPRESARRKLFRLAARGWVTQDPVRGWRLAGTTETVTARSDLSDLDRRSLDRLARLMAGLLPLFTPPAEGGDPVQEDPAPG